MDKITEIPFDTYVTEIMFDEYNTNIKNKKKSFCFDDLINDDYIFNMENNKYLVREGVIGLHKLKNACIGVEKEIEDMIEKEKEQKKENEQEKENECPICLESIIKKSYFTGKCGHKFCSSCICENMSKNTHTGHKCPLCRDDFM